MLGLPDDVGRLGGGVLIMPKLSEGQYAVVVESMALVTRAESHLERTLYALKDCKIEVDESSFANIRYHLDKIHAELSPLPLAHADAVRRAV